MQHEDSKVVCITWNVQRKAQRTRAVPLCTWATLAGYRQFLQHPISCLHWDPLQPPRYCYYQERLLSLFCEYVFAAFIIFADVVSATAMAPDRYIKRDKSNKVPANIEEPSLSWRVNPCVVCSLLGFALTKWQPRIQKANVLHQSQSA